MFVTGRIVAAGHCVIACNMHSCGRGYSSTCTSLATGFAGSSGFYYTVGYLCMQTQPTCCHCAKGFALLIVLHSFINYSRYIVKPSYRALYSEIIMFHLVYYYNREEGIATGLL